jgi:hypothetical protein
VNETPGSDTQGTAEPPPDAQPVGSQVNDHVEGVSLPLRLYSSPLVHRLVPAGLALPIAASIGPAVRERRNPAERGDAQRFMHDLLLHTPRADEADRLAERWLAEKSRLRELFWRPWLLRHSQVHGGEHWAAAHVGGRGCVVVFGHLTAAWAVPAILALRGYDHYVVVSPHYWHAPPPGYEGLALLHRRREYGEKLFDESRLLAADERPARLLELLQGGASMAIAFDVPGWAATPFLGRNVALGGGPATLSFKANANVLPVIAERHGSRLDLRLLPPLDPNDFADLRSLRVGIAQTFEALVLGQPEAVEMAWHPSPLITEVAPQRLASSRRDTPAG